jgi:hypothetical protein
MNPHEVYDLTLSFSRIEQLRFPSGIPAAETLRRPRARHKPKPAIVSGSKQALTLYARRRFRRPYQSSLAPSRPMRVCAACCPTLPSVGIFAAEVGQRELGGSSTYGGSPSNLGLSASGLQNGRASAYSPRFPIRSASAIRITPAPTRSTSPAPALLLLDDGICPHLDPIERLFTRTSSGSRWPRCSTDDGEGAASIGDAATSEA